MILTCLEGDEDGREALQAAKALAAGGGLRLVVVRVISRGADALANGTPTEWTLRTDSPVEPLIRFTRRNRVKHVVLGARAWARWGGSIMAS